MQMDTLQYKSVLASKLGGQPVAVVATAAKGHCLLSRVSVPSGGFVFGEAPLGSQQYARNKALVRACDHCHRFIGTLEDQFQRLAAVSLSTVQLSKLQKWEAKSIVRDVKKQFPALKGFKCPLVDDSTIAPVVHCKWGCDAEFCSEQCYGEATRRYHALLCTGRPPKPSAPHASAAPPAQDEDMHHHEHEHGEGDGIEEEEEEEGDGIEEEEDEEGEGGEDADHDHMEEEGEGVNAAALFEHQALSTNEVFLLAGRLIGRVLESWARNGHDLPAAMLPLTSLHSAHWAHLFELRQQADEAKAALQEEEEGEEEEGEEEEEEEEEEAGQPPLGEQVNEWLRDSLTILKALVQQRVPAIVQACGKVGHSRTSLEAWECDMLLNVDVYSRLLGAFELNQLEMKVESPVRDYLKTVGEACAKGTPGAKEAAAILLPVCQQIERAYHARHQLLLAVSTAVGEEEDAAAEVEDMQAEDGEVDEVEGPLLTIEVPPSSGSPPPFPVLPSRYPVSDGTVLYSLICTMNHSCDPNVQVMYAEGNHVGVLVAQRDIGPGEELCINYVDTEQSREARRLDLLHYGFTCDCSKCQEEEEEEA